MAFQKQAANAQLGTCTESTCATGTYSHTLCVIDISRPAHMTLTGFLDWVGAIGCPKMQLQAKSVENISAWLGNACE